MYEVTLDDGSTILADEHIEDRPDITKQIPLVALNDADAEDVADILLVEGRLYARLSS